MPYFGRSPDDASSAEEHAHLMAVKEHTEREDARKIAQKKQWAIEDAARDKAALELRTARQRASDDQLKAELRQRFFRANPAGSEADFTRLLPAMRDAEMLERARHGVSEEVAALRARTPGL